MLASLVQVTKADAMDIFDAIKTGTERLFELKPTPILSKFITFGSCGTPDNTGKKADVISLTRFSLHPYGHLFCTSIRFRLKGLHENGHTV